MTDSADCVVLRVGASRYAVPMQSVAEVSRVSPITRVPGLPEWLAGVVNWRGRILGVLDLHGVLGGGRPAAGGSARLVVLIRDRVTVGLLADAVVGAQRLPDDVEPPLASLSGPAADLLAGHVTDDDGPVTILDVAAVFRLRDGLPRATPRAG